MRVNEICRALAEAPVNIIMTLMDFRAGNAASDLVTLRGDSDADGQWEMRF